MFATLLTVALFAAPALQGVVAEFSVATPAITQVDTVSQTTIFRSNILLCSQCSPVQITWAKTTGPYNLIVVPAADPCGDVLSVLLTGFVRRRLTYFSAALTLATTPVLP